MLYIIGTPIGNLEDLSFRAKRILSEVDFVLAEDTRQSRKLLARYQINKSLVSFHEHSGNEKINWVIKNLKEGKDIAYVSDGGTPNLCDPGGKLTAAVLANGIKISPIPGPSPLLTLISVAPFSCSEFIFKGFFPKKKGREKMVGYIANQDIPVFFFESPHRIKKTLAFLSARLPDYRILIGRELTKIHEEVIFADLTDGNILEKINSKGEFVFGLIKTKKY
ncbi:MAG: 16S rRNA (cytidine(1402)-2'-O)-methyltransferase [Candidatus Berkelbacteria bacterium]|nr:16S rRNA (cytidine(1402)-2'-O)-methyltransferase [Candidatus Berkelbacteria bacterium]